MKELSINFSHYVKKLANSDYVHLFEDWTQLKIPLDDSEIEISYDRYQKHANNKKNVCIYLYRKQNQLLIIFSGAHRRKQGA